MKRNSHQQKSGDISACQGWTVLVITVVYKRAFIDFLIKRNSYQQKSGDISACQSWTVLVITAVSHISAADFTIPLSNHISQGKCFGIIFWYWR